MRYLSKSRFKLALECPTKLYYTGKRTYPDKKANDSFLQALAEGGFQVGELAKLYYPEGHDIVEGGYEVPLQRTNELLQQENVIIYEAAILYDKLFIRVDVLVKERDSIKLIEVKAKSFSGDDENNFCNKKGFITPSYKPYLYDVAFQKYVVEHAFPNYNVKAYLMLADKKQKSSIAGLNQKFQLVKTANGRTGVRLIGDTSLASLGNKILTEISVDNICDKIFQGRDSSDTSELSFEERVKLYADAYADDKKVYTPIGKHCAACEFHTDDAHKLSGFQECWMDQTRLDSDDFSKPHIFDLWNFRGKEQCIQEGILLLKDFPKEYLGEVEPNNDGTLSSKERQWLQVEKVANNDNTPYIDLDGLSECINSHNYPLHFIDFETSMVAIPFYEDSTPYEQIAFQYSHHVMEADGSVRHESQFIYIERGQFPNFDFLRSLKKDLSKDMGSIFRFADHENTVLNQIKNQLIESTVEDCDELINFIDSITHDTKTGRTGERDMVDMRKIVLYYHYDPYTGGSNSIKKVLPAVLRRSESIQKKYSKAIYGKDCTIPSLNFVEPMSWIQKDNSNTVINPYKLLPPIFDDLPQDEVDNFICNDSIAEGGAALTAFAKMQFTEMSDTEREHVISGLLRYCELDTLAMVLIYEYWLEVLKIENK